MSKRRAKVAGLTNNVDDVIETPRLGIERCRFCADETIVPAWGKEIVHHLIVTIDSERHVHVHGPIDDTITMETFIKAIKQEVGKAFAASITTMDSDYLKI